MNIQSILIVELDVSVNVFDYIKASIESGISTTIDGALITSVNITTECISNGSGYQCMCENQYFWPCDLCTLYGSCNNSSSLCSCINAFPNDGQFCQPITELNSTTCPPVTARALTSTAVTSPAIPLAVDYVVEVEIDLENYIFLEPSQQFGINLPISYASVNILQINVTTVCSLNGSGYQCMCEDQYYWPCELCTVYGSCNTVNSSLCSCINDFPNDGQFCQPLTELNSTTCPTVTPTVDYVVEVEIDSEDGTVLEHLQQLGNNLPISYTYVNILQINMTTVCSLNGSGYQCMCEDQYFWPCETCILYGSCDSIINSTCGCINAFPNNGHFCQPVSQLTNNSCPAVVTTATTTTSTTTAITSTVPTTTVITSTSTTTAITYPITPSAAGPHTVTTLTFSLIINEVFDLALTDQSSATYMTYKSMIQNAIDSSYRSVSAYVANSATVTDFRSGSIIADFTIQSTNVNIYLVSANQIATSALRSEGFNVSNNAFSETVFGGLYTSNSLIYPGTNLILVCNPPVNNGIQWTLNGNSLGQYNSTLQINNVSPSQSGIYACTTTLNSLPYVIWQTITIQPYPNIQVSSNKIIECQDTTIQLQCCVQDVYQVKWSSICTTVPSPPGLPPGCILCNYTVNVQNCQANGQESNVMCQLTNPISGSTAQNLNVKSITIQVENGPFACNDPVFGAGNVGNMSTGDCSIGYVGSQEAQCNSSNLWNPIQNQCVLYAFAVLSQLAQTLTVSGIPQFLVLVSSNATENIQNIINSPATIVTIVEILSIVANVSQTTFLSQPSMTNFLTTTDVVGSNGSQTSWISLNNNTATANVGSQLLSSTESISRRLPENNFMITTSFSSLNKTFITGPFSGTFGLQSTTQIDIPETSGETSFTVIISSALNNILPVRNLTLNDSSQTNITINADVTLIETNTTINNISLTFTVINQTLRNPQCVFWNFNLLDGIGGWDSTGCEVKTIGNETDRYTCECNHTTSFSMLMSPFTLSEEVTKALDYITYIGVAISLASLILCLFTEIIIWRSVTRNDTSYLRHVAIVNIAFSLLIADICFMIAASLVKDGGTTPVGSCSTVTFFMHFFYLALFFWMLLSALLLLYRTVMVFSRMTRGAMLAIAFTIGYGAPLLIAAITVASTAGHNGYIQLLNNCWLNWTQTKALLAFVIPALTIVVINLIVLIVVLYKILRRGVNASTQPDEKHPLLVIARCVAILTPLFGITWGFGIGTLVSADPGIHIVFAFFNSLQGFFILVFGTLLDSKVREALAETFSLKNMSSVRTRSTSTGPSSSSGFPLFSRLRQRNAYVHTYNISSGGVMSSTSSNS